MNQYIRTENGIYEVVDTYEVSYVIGYTEDGFDKKVYKEDVIKQANTIEELCDEFVVIEETQNYVMEICSYKGLKDNGWIGSNFTIYGAIWTDKGLIYVAKMNEDGVLCLI